MSETPKVGDKIRVTFEGAYEETLGLAAVRRSDGFKIYPGDWGKVEVIERADDPSRDPIGTVRRRPAGTSAGTSYVKTAYPTFPWVRLDSGHAGDNGGWRLGGNSDGDVIGWPIIGAVPGTPAAVAQAEQFVAELAGVQPAEPEPLAEWERELLEPVEPVYEYFRSPAYGKVYRVKGDRVEFYSTRAQEWMWSCCLADDIRHNEPRVWTKLDGEPDEVKPKPVEITANSPEPDRSKRYRDVQGDSWTYDGGWRFYDAGSDYESSTYRWDQVVSLFPTEFPWHLAADGGE
jgi:hypothetical protein